MKELKNPCLYCDHHLAGKSKDDPCCGECDKRIEYVMALGGLSEAVPLGINLNGNGGHNIPDRPKPIEKENVRGMKTCKRCKEKKELKLFRTNKRAPDGHFNTCEKCMSRRNYKNDQRVSGSQEEKLITLDFAEHEDLFDTLVKDAKDELRALDNYLLYWIDQMWMEE